jgi:hypothetical protein
MAAATIDSTRPSSLPAKSGIQSCADVRSLVSSEAMHSAPPATAVKSSGAMGARTEILRALHKAQTAMATAALMLNCVNRVLSWLLLIFRIILILGRLRSPKQRRQRRSISPAGCKPTGDTQVLLGARVAAANQSLKNAQAVQAVVEAGSRPGHFRQWLMPRRPAEAPRRSAWRWCRRPEAPSQSSALAHLEWQGEECPAQHQADPQGHACLQLRAPPGREGVASSKLWHALRAVDKYLRGQAAWLVNYAKRCNKTHCANAESISAAEQSEMATIV